MNDKNATNIARNPNHGLEVVLSPGAQDQCSVHIQCGKIIGKYQLIQPVYNFWTKHFKKCKLKSSTLDVKTRYLKIITSK